MKLKRRIHCLSITHCLTSSLNGRAGRLDPYVEKTSCSPRQLQYLGRGFPLLAVNSIKQGGLSHHFRGIDQALTQPLGNPNRSGVLRMDQADDVRLAQLSEGKLESGP